MVSDYEIPVELMSACKKFVEYQMLRKYKLE